MNAETLMQELLQQIRKKPIFISKYALHFLKKTFYLAETVPLNSIAELGIIFAHQLLKLLKLLIRSDFRGNQRSNRCLITWSTVMNSACVLYCSKSSICLSYPQLQSKSPVKKRLSHFRELFNQFPNI